MNASDLIVLVPWVIFGACLIAICIRLLTWRRGSRRPPAPGRRHGRR
jgi:hypothetical protein